MVSRRRLIRIVAFVGIILSSLVLSPAIGKAAEILGSQVVNQPATLVGPKEKAPIPLYLRPAPNQPNVGYGINGDLVTVMEQLASFLPEADQSTAWNHIRLEHEPYTEGWVQGKFLSMVKANLEE
ncbi:MAG: hypothetical protein AAGA83_27215 [Cyanobacteria bacterium P01_F01_bin.116]